MLEELILSENSIEEIPQTIAMMTNLKVLDIDDDGHNDDDYGGGDNDDVMML